MTHDFELHAWQRQWQSAPDDASFSSAAELRSRIVRESRRMRIGLIAPVAVTIGIGAGVLLRALTSVERADLVLALGTWVGICIVWIGSLWIAHGTWRPLAETTAAYVDLSIRRCVSNSRAARFAVGFYVFQLLFVVLWKLEYSSIGIVAVLTAWPLVVIGWVGFPVFLGWVVWYSMRKRAQLTDLVELRRQLTEPV